MIRRFPAIVLFIATFTSGLVLQAPARDVEAEEALPFKIYFDQKIKMRDGTELSADVYRPDGPGKFPCILSRTPYLKSGAGTAEFGKYFAAHGYAFVAVDVRGRGDSQAFSFLIAMKDATGTTASSGAPLSPGPAAKWAPSADLTMARINGWRRSSNRRT